MLECAVVGRPDASDLVKPEAYVVLSILASTDSVGLGQVIRPA